MATHQTTVRLSLDALRIVNIHRAKHPDLGSMNDVINDIIVRHSTLEEATSAPEASAWHDVIDLANEHQSSIEQITMVSLRNFALIIEIASSIDSALPQKGEQRARLLLKQMQNKP
ncbi:MAG: hypothetical protein ACJA13_002514 [Paraglaciecola sp.]|jgi:hypothetical protein